MLDSENTKKSKEMAELQARVALDEQREEENRRESFGLKQKMAESEASRESARKEVRSKPWGLLGRWGLCLPHTPCIPLPRAPE